MGKLIVKTSEAIGTSGVGSLLGRDVAFTDFHKAYFSEKKTQVNEKDILYFIYKSFHETSKFFKNFIVL